MNSPNLRYPDLYYSADTASANAQSSFLWTIRLEYILLFITSALISFRSEFPPARIFITIILVILGGLLVFKFTKKLDQYWYRSRALAESVKTSTWRFCMRAHPFGDAENIAEPKANFRNLLREILMANSNIAQGLTSDASDQISPSMLEVRALSLGDRRDFYITNRIDSQRIWYTKKAKLNKSAAIKWVWITVLIYLFAVAALFAGEIGVPEVISAFDPLIVIATSVLGWIQTKRYGELAASYNLTAHEIGIVRSNSDSVKTELEFSDFVNEAELAFSREHTQWVARKDAN